MIEPMASHHFETGRVKWAIDEIRPGKTYLEIGSFRGGSLSLYGRQMEAGAKLVSVDRPLSKPGIREDLSTAIIDLRTDGYDAVWIEGNSHAPEIVARVREAAPVVDVLFIDGDHTADGVMQDVANYVPLVRSGGLVVFHDVGPCDWTADGRGKVVFDACFAAWRSVAKDNKRKMIVQINSGYGLVWIN